MKKKPQEMSFKEFWEKEEKRAEDKGDIKEEKRLMLETLRSKGFSERQINEMKVDKAWKICQPVLWEGIERHMKILESSLSRVSGEYITAFRSLQTLWQDPEQRKLLVTDKALRKEIFGLAASMDDLERGLFQLEETALQGLKELKRKLKEKEMKK